MTTCKMVFASAPLLQSGMTNASGSCIICGDSPTIKAHLFPRAIMADLREDAKALVQGDRTRDGYTLPQNGEWDDTILCKHHEDIIGAGDNYAVRFFRSGLDRGRLVENGKALAVPNPHPDRLVHFAYSTVWRVAVSRAGRRSGLNLGRYEPILRDSLLGRTGYDLQVLIGISNLRLGEERPVPFCLYPYRQRLRAWNTWHFVLGGFDFHLLTDQRPFPVEWKPYLANGNDPLILTATDPMDIRTVPMLQPLLGRMLKGPALGQQRR